ncbi:hypothetical protein [Streptomyces cinereoruber]
MTFFIGSVTGRSAGEGFPSEAADCREGGTVWTVAGGWRLLSHQLIKTVA